MKKFLMIAALALGVSAAAMAQPRAIGGRLGATGLEASYEHTLGGSNFVEVNAGLDYFYGVGAKAAATYNFMVAQPNWTDRGEWGVYVGPGLTTGWVGDTVKYKYNEGGVTYNYTDWGRGFMFGLAAQVGLEYTFWFPLQLSVDIRPYIGMHIWNGEIHNDGSVKVNTEKKIGFYETGLYGFIPTLSVRYRF